MSAIVGFYGNKMYNLDDIQESDINIFDIGWALSQNLRFNGHSLISYSVAEHCVALSKVVPEGYELAAFLHDAAEAFIGDIVTPVKRLCPEVELIEDHILCTIFNKYGCHWSQLEVVMRWDWQMCRAEAKQIMGDPDWARTGEPYLDYQIGEEKTPHQRRLEYYQRFTELTHQIVPLDDPRLTRR